MKRKLAIGVAGTALTGFIGFIATAPGGLMLFIRPIKTIRQFRQRGRANSLYEHLGEASLDASQLTAVANQGWCSQELFNELCIDQPLMKPDMKRRLAIALGLSKPSGDAYIPAPQPA